MKDIIEKIRALVTEAATNPKSHTGIAVYDSGIRDGMRDLAKSVLAILPAVEVPEHPMIVNVRWLPSAPDPEQWMKLVSDDRKNWSADTWSDSSSDSSEQYTVEWAIFHGSDRLTNWFESKGENFEPEVFWTLKGTPKVFWIDVSVDDQQPQYDAILKYLDETYPQTPSLAEFQWLDGEKIGPWASVRSRTSDRDEWAFFHEDRRLTHWLKSPDASLEPETYWIENGTPLLTPISFWIDVSVQNRESQYNAIREYLLKTTPASSTWMKNHLEKP